MDDPAKEAPLSFDVWDEEVKPKRITPEECLAVYGYHEDDGSFMMGFCKRCQECLG